MSPCQATLMISPRKYVFGKIKHAFGKAKGFKVEVRKIFPIKVISIRAIIHLSPYHRFSDRPQIIKRTHTLKIKDVIVALKVRNRNSSSVTPRIYPVIGYLEKLGENFSQKIT